MPGAAAQVHQPPLGEEDDPLPVGEYDVVDLWLDLLPFVLLYGGDVDLVVEVADVADNGLVLHLLHVIGRDHMKIAVSGDEDVRLVASGGPGPPQVAFHRRARRLEPVDLPDPL